MAVDVSGETPALYTGSTLKMEAAFSYGSSVRVWRWEQRVPAPCYYPLMNYTLL